MRLSGPIHKLKRRARLLARDEKIALHEALDRIAREEGFVGWSLLSARAATSTPSKVLLSRLAAGDLLLLGARPGHGKTLFGLKLLIEAIREGRDAVFLTLEYTPREVWERIRTFGDDAIQLAEKLDIVTSDEISAGYIIDRLSGSAPGTVAVIDYLQLLDQKRTKPALADQMETLRNFARGSGVVLGFISQIDRSFDPDRKPLPDVNDIRLPNPLDLGLFSKTCFLHDGEVRVGGIA